MTQKLAIVGASLVLGLFCALVPLPVRHTFAQPPVEIALTFDDGPYGAPTAEILDILEKEHVPATFFLIGKNVEKYPSLVQREVADGDLIGNHTYDHAKNLASSTAAAFQAELDGAEQAIASTTGIHTNFFRPPYGNMSSAMAKVLQNDGYTTVMWNIDTRDWDFAASPAQSIVASILSSIKPNSVIILHDGRDTHIGYPRDNTVEAVAALVPALKELGYTFVTVDKLPPQQPQKN